MGRKRHNLKKKERAAKHVEQRVQHEPLFEVSIVTLRSPGNGFKNSSACYSSWYTHYSPCPFPTLLMDTTTVNMAKGVHVGPIKSCHGTVIRDTDESIRRLCSYKFNLHYQQIAKACQIWSHASWGPWEVGNITSASSNAYSVKYFYQLKKKERRSTQKNNEEERLWIKSLLLISQKQLTDKLFRHIPNAEHTDSSIWQSYTLLSKQASSEKRSALKPCLQRRYGYKEVHIYIIQVFTFYQNVLSNLVTL